ncbi:MAG: FIST C-terminal domain-containing protein [Alphaproteobacteria bacterium]|nr:FIST C-terminal domain-containing protein [Alphaproteobacteria bacterium]
MAFHHGLATGGDWQSLAAACAEQLAPGKGLPLGIFYVSEKLIGDTRRIVDLLKEQTGIGHWAGAVGFGICATGIEVYDEPAMCAMACDVPADAFRIFGPLAHPGDRLPDTMHSWLAGQSQRLGVVHADPRNGEVPVLIEELARDSDAYLVGAITADGGVGSQIAEAGTGNSILGGISGVLFGDGAGFVTGLTQGCSPIGSVHDVTVGDEDMLMELDGRPALEILQADLGADFDGDWRKIAGVIFAGLPVKGSDTGDYLVRGIHGLDPLRGWLQIGAHIETGDRLLFVRRDATTALADLERMLERFAARTNGPPKAGLYHNCIGRGRSQFGPGSEELATIKEKLGDFPLVGMFGNGEVSYDRIYSYTGVLTLFV